MRERLGTWIRPDQRRTVVRWCDWADAVLGSPGPAVLVHGDLHGDNQVWDRDELRQLHRHSGADDLLVRAVDRPEARPPFLHEARLDDGAVVPRLIAARHALQNHIVTRLHRQLELTADDVARRHHLEELRLEVLRV